MPVFEKITVSVIVDADIGRAWRAFTSPDSIVKWNFASDDWRCPRASNDLKKGGTFNYRMESKDADVGFDFCGTYTEVVVGKRIRYILGDDREVSIGFRDMGGKTEVTEIFDAEKENSPELQKRGWQAILDNFKKHAESIG